MKIERYRGYPIVQFDEVEENTMFWDNFFETLADEEVWDEVKPIVEVWDSGAILEIPLKDYMSREGFENLKKQIKERE